MSQDRDADARRTSPVCSEHPPFAAAPQSKSGKCAEHLKRSRRILESSAHVDMAAQPAIHRPESEAGAQTRNCESENGVQRAASEERIVRDTRSLAVLFSWRAGVSVRHGQHTLESQPQSDLGKFPNHTRCLGTEYEISRILLYSSLLQVLRSEKPRHFTQC
jgi:hypothetical protein